LKNATTWTLKLRDGFTGRLDSGPSFLIRLGSSEGADALSDTSAFLLGTALAWLLTTTNVDGRARAAMSLARLLAHRPGVAVMLVRRFSENNDPYVVERVLFAVAACVIMAQPSKELVELVDAVYTAAFGGPSVTPNVIIRYYASVVCEEGSRKGALSTNIRVEKFRPPYISIWPLTLTNSEVEALEKDWRANTDSMRALGRLLASTVTEQMGGYGDWGRYEMGWRVGMFQSQRRNQEPLQEWNAPSFDDRVARRYVLKRALELGLDKALDDAPRYDPNVGRARPPVERLGKKYQWIALHEFLGFLSDHYHPRPDYDGVIPVALTPQDVHLDLLDPVLVRQAPRSSCDHLQFVSPPPPWWINILTPLPAPFDRSAREEFVASREGPNPIRLLTPRDGNEAWMTLKGHWEWREPIPCYRVGRIIFPHTAVYLGTSTRMQYRHPC
jgi:hypothetical protein